jgi:hypothetical protein
VEIASQPEISTETQAGIKKVSSLLKKAGQSRRIDRAAAAWWRFIRLAHR